VTDEESSESESDDDINIVSSNAREKTEINLLLRPLIMTKFIQDVKFISNHEMKFVDVQRKKYPRIGWFTNDNQKQVKPSATWFSKDHPWLRAVCTENRYGLLCIDCAQLATDKTLIERNNGAFVLRPYWKLKHKGLPGSIHFLYTFIFI